MAESLENDKTKGTKLVPGIPSASKELRDRDRSRDRFKRFFKKSFNVESGSKSKSPHCEGNANNDVHSDHEPPMCAAAGVNIVDSKPKGEPFQTSEMPTSRSTDAGKHLNLHAPTSIDVPAGGLKGVPSIPVTPIGVDIKIVTPIAELWNQAYEELRDKERKLINKYEEEITSLSILVGQTVKLSGVDKVSRRLQMEELVRRKLADDENGKWAIPLGDDRIAIRDLAGSVASIIDWGQSFVGEALQFSPYGSLAWAGVCLLLPVSFFLTDLILLPVGYSYLSVSPILSFYQNVLLALRRNFTLLQMNNYYSEFELVALIYK